MPNYEPLRALTHFPLQSGQEVGVAVPRLTLQPNFICSGITPLGALKHFPLQSAQGVEAVGPKYIFGHVRMMVTCQPNFSPIS